MSDTRRPSLRPLRDRVMSMSAEEYKRFREALMATHRAHATASDFLRDREHLLAKYGDKPDE